MKSEKNVSIFSLIITLLLGVVLGGGLMFLFGEKQNDDINKKSEILTEVMRKWKNNEIKIDDENLKLIKSVKSKAGQEPFQYEVIFEMKDGKQIIYGWKDKNKSSIEEVK